MRAFAPGDGLGLIFAIFVAGLVWLITLVLVKLGGKEIVKRAGVPRFHKNGEYPAEDTHETAKVGEQVKEVVPAPVVGQNVHVHLESHLDLLTVSRPQGSGRLALQVEQVLLDPFCPGFEIGRFIVL